MTMATFLLSSVGFCGGGHRDKEICPSTPKKERSWFGGASDGQVHTQCSQLPDLLTHISTNSDWCFQQNVMLRVVLQDLGSVPPSPGGQLLGALHQKYVCPVNKPGTTLHAKDEHCTAIKVLSTEEHMRVSAHHLSHERAVPLAR